MIKHIISNNKHNFSLDDKLLFNEWLNSVQVKIINMDTYYLIQDRYDLFNILRKDGTLVYNEWMKSIFINDSDEIIVERYIDPYQIADINGNIKSEKYNIWHKDAMSKRIVVCSDNKYNIIKNGKCISNVWFDRITYYDDTFCVIKNNNSFNFLDYETGKLVFPNNFSKIIKMKNIPYFLIIQDNQIYEYSVLDKDLKLIPLNLTDINSDVENITNLSKHYIFYLNKNDVLCIYNKKEKKNIFELDIGYCYLLTEHIAYFYNDSLNGLIDNNSSFSFIDLKNNKIIKTQSSIASIYGYVEYNKSNGIISIYNWDFKLVKEYKYNGYKRDIKIYESYIHLYGKKTLISLIDYNIYEYNSTLTCKTHFYCDENTKLFYLRYCIVKTKLINNGQN